MLLWTRYVLNRALIASTFEDHLQYQGELDPSSPWSLTIGSKSPLEVIPYNGHTYPINQQVAWHQQSPLARAMALVKTADQVVGSHCALRCMDPWIAHHELLELGQHRGCIHAD